MSCKVNFRVLLLSSIIVIVQRTCGISAQQEERFFYNADFPAGGGGDDQQLSESKPEPVFPDGPLKVSLGLRALSGDNRPQFANAQV